MQNWGLCLAFLEFQCGRSLWRLKHLYTCRSWSPEPSLEDRPWSSRFKKFVVYFFGIPEIVPADQNLVLYRHCLLRYARAWDPSFWKGDYFCTAVSSPFRRQSSASQSLVPRLYHKLNKNNLKNHMSLAGWRWSLGLAVSRITSRCEVVPWAAALCS